MIDTLARNPVLVLGVVVGLGAALGRVRVRGFSLGPAGALFVGLAVGAWDERLALPEVLQALGLALFAYTVGIASGPTFVGGLRRGGGRVVAATTVVIVAFAGVVAVVGSLLGADTGHQAGVFAGTTTNTPALAAAVARLAGEGRADPVVAYSLAYPTAVIAMIVAANLLLRRQARAVAEGSVPAAREPTVSWTVRVLRDGLPALGELRTWKGASLAFGRYQRADGTVDVATSDVVLHPGDLVVVVGTEEAVRDLASWLGQRSDRHLALDRSTYDMRRMSVSRHQLAGTRIGDLDLPGRYGATITRVRRGDTDIAATDAFTLQLGDRVRVVGPVRRLPEVARFLGDSERELSEVDAVGLGIGLAVGIAIGLLKVPVPGGGTIALGGAGGPLVAGLLLSLRARTGPITYQLPTNTGLTLRQLGTLVFLGCIGTRSGTAFREAIVTATGVRLALAGLAASFVLAALAVVVFGRFTSRDPVMAAGLLAGMQGTPAVLAFATERTDGDERVGTGYALAFPVGMILKIVTVQFVARP